MLPCCDGEIKLYI